MDRMTDACENITFPQLLFRTVKIHKIVHSPSQYNVDLQGMYIRRINKYQMKYGEYAKHSEAIKMW